jgi:hypothetical protein
MDDNPGPGNPPAHGTRQDHEKPPENPRSRETPTKNRGRGAPPQKNPILRNSRAIEPINRYDAPERNRRDALGGEGRREMITGEHLRGRAHISSRAAAAARSCGLGEGSGGAPPG